MMDSVTRAMKRLIRRTARKIAKGGDPQPPGPPPLFEDPMEALCYEQGGRKAAFRLPLEQTRHLTGFTFSSKGWHPFVKAAEEHGLELADGYESSVLAKYYRAWQPASAREAYVGFRDAPDRFARLPTWNIYATPWTSLSIQEVRGWIDGWYRLDYRPHGLAHFTLESHGLKHFGPVHPDLATIEYQRLIDVYDSLRARGYDRKGGDVYVDAVRRGGELRFLSAGGWHRKAAMAALGNETLPARFKNPFVYDVDLADRWPNVRSGLWDRKAAVAYVDYLFDFDARSWAEERGLLLEQLHPRVESAPAL